METVKEIVEAIKNDVQEFGKKTFPVQSEWRQGALHVKAEVTESDRLAVKLNKLTVKNHVDKPLGGDDFKQLLLKLQQQITYLPESLKIVEVDLFKSKALLCSDKPIKEHEAREYFRMLVDSSVNILFQRVRNQNNRDEIVPFVISFDLLERFIQDCLASVRNDE